MVDIDTANYKSEIKELKRELAARDQQLIVATKLADSRYNELQELQSDLRAQVAEQWISVDDRSPDLDQDVLVYLSPRDAHSLIKIVSTTFTKYGYERACVSHWLPLPSPPQGTKS